MLRFVAVPSGHFVLFYVNTYLIFSFFLNAFLYTARLHVHYSEHLPNVISIVAERIRICIGIRIGLE
jgi:hypothetical protein